MIVILAFIAYFLLIPSDAFAWGPLTHMYLGTEIYYFASVIPAAVAGLIRKYRQDYLYGNIMADMVIGKKYSPSDKSSHSWDAGAALFEASSTDSEKAFALGYMSHLAADTVAHGRYTAGSRNLGHTMLELGADCLIDPGYWRQAVRIDKEVQDRNDALMARCLDVVMFSFNTNKRVFKGALALSCLNREKLTGLFTDSPSRLKKKGLIDSLHDESVDRIVDVLSNGTRSEVLKMSPIANLKRNRLFKALLN
jgi:hypothetical protein